ncbi:MAG: NAD(P)-binding protein [Verrucomicrobia bacterium]|nr:NAD(P)-binding protein [Verrucomicrobiota bacterium]
MTALRPIEIVGGGLAGLSLGLALRRTGVPVTVLEAGTYPRHKVCGEFIAGLSGKPIARLGLAPFLTDALRLGEIAWFIDGKVARHQSLPAPALGLSRHTLDARLAAAFTAAGGTLRTHTRATLDPAPGRVIATGRRRETDSPWIGLKVHALGLPLARDLELHLGADAYVGLARLPDDRVNICGLFRRRELCAKGSDLLLGYLQAAGLVALAKRIVNIDTQSFSAVVALGFDARLPAYDGTLRLGDAGALIPPFTGNGMAMAFQSAELALDPLLAYARGDTAWPDACLAVHRALRRHFRLRLAAAHTLHPFLHHPPRQRTLARLAPLLPLRPLHAALH